jgi:hypothetical protein
MAEGHSELANEHTSAANGIDYAYRDTGGDSEGGVPLVLLQHFRGNLDNWDPALIDALASTRRVVMFDNAGVGGSTGTTPDTIEQMARDAIAFIAAMQFDQVDLLGFSIGSFVAQGTERRTRRPREEHWPGYWPARGVDRWLVRASQSSSASPTVYRRRGRSPTSSSSCSSLSLSRTSTLVLSLTFLRMRVQAGLKPRSTAPIYRFLDASQQIESSP